MVERDDREKEMKDEKYFLLVTGCVALCTQPVQGVFRLINRLENNFVPLFFCFSFRSSATRFPVTKACHCLYASYFLFLFDFVCHTKTAKKRQILKTIDKKCTFDSFFFTEFYLVFRRKLIPVAFIDGKFWIETKTRSHHFSKWLPSFLSFFFPNKKTFFFGCRKLGPGGWFARWGRLIFIYFFSIFFWEGGLFAVAIWWIDSKEFRFFFLFL